MIDQLKTTVRESPLVAGAVAMALGAIAAAAIPESEKENELLGSTRDRVVDRGKEMAREKMKAVKEAATEA